MANLEQINQLVETIGLLRYSVYNELGEIIDDATAVVGYQSPKSLEMSLEFVNNTPGVAAIQQLFQRSMDGQAVILLGNVEEVLPTLRGHKNVDDELTFHIGDALYCTGIIITPST